MKKLRLLIIVFFVLSLTGCMQNYVLTDQQTDETAEYMAGLLLKYDKDYKPSLTPMEDLDKADNTAADESTQVIMNAPTPTPAHEEAASGNSEGGNTSQEAIAKEYTLSEVIGVKDIDIKYKGYKTCEAYPDDTTNVYFSLTPREGTQLLVVSFTLKNLSDKAKSLNLSKMDVKYQLDVNVGTVYKPLLTLLENDLQYLKTTIEAGKTKTVQLIFEVSKDTDMSNINLIASKDNKTEIIEIK